VIEKKIEREKENKSWFLLTLMYEITPVQFGTFP